MAVSGSDRDSTVVYTPIVIKRRKSVLAYTACVVLAGLTLIVMTLPGLPPRPWPDLVVFVLLAALAEYWVVPAGSAPTGSAMSTSFTVNFAATVLFGPAFGALVAVIGVTLSFGFVRRIGFLKTAFNAGQMAVTVVPAGLAFEALRAGPHLTLSSDAVAFAVAAVIYLVVSCTLPAVFLTLCGRHVSYQMLLLLREDGLFYIAMAPIGILVACAYQQSRWNVLYFPFLLVAVYKGFALYASLQTRD